VATEWPAPADIEGEGDCEYIGPEILMDKFDKPADVYLEIAGNVELPDNGPSWQKLRTGDISDVRRSGTNPAILSLEIIPLRISIGLILAKEGLGLQNPRVGK